MRKSVSPASPLPSHLLPVRNHSCSGADLNFIGVSAEDVVLLKNGKGMRHRFLFAHEVYLGFVPFGEEK